MNALANSQLGELEKFLQYGYPDAKGPVTFARYTGQESEEDRQKIKADPPDILLTNYVMLELMTTRPDDRPIIQGAQGLRFLVLDELHTYRGRQGADVAMLVRRVRDLLNAPDLQCVGTSATLAGPGSYGEQQQEVAKMASLLFGTSVPAESIIGETIRRSTVTLDFSDDQEARRLAERVDGPSLPDTIDHHSFVSDPLTAWIEETFGIDRDVATGRLTRATPRAVRGDGGAAELLSSLTGCSVEACVSAIERTLLEGYHRRNPDTDKPIFAFRLHQFISRGDTVYASLETEATRYITLNGQQFVPGDRTRVLMPLVFCRDAGTSTTASSGNGQATGGLALSVVTT